MILEVRNQLVNYKHKLRAGTKVQREEHPTRSEESMKGWVGAVVERSYAAGAGEELDIQ